MFRYSNNVKEERESEKRVENQNKEIKPKAEKGSPLRQKDGPTD